MSVMALISSTVLMHQDGDPIMNRVEQRAVLRRLVPEDRHGYVEMNRDPGVQEILSRAPHSGGILGRDDAHRAALGHPRIWTMGSRCARRLCRYSGSEMPVRRLPQSAAPVMLKIYGRRTTTRNTAAYLLGQSPDGDLAFTIRGLPCAGLE